VINSHEGDVLLLRIPFHKPASEVHNIVRKKAEWILRKQLEYRVNKSQIVKPTFQHDSTLPYSGKNYSLHIISDQETGEKFVFENGQFLVYTNEFKFEKKKINLLYEKWLMFGRLTRLIASVLSFLRSSISSFQG
jgi:predicted metal-dependent hydrolase